MATLDPVTVGNAAVALDTGLTTGETYLCRVSQPFRAIAVYEAAAAPADLDDAQENGNVYPAGDGSPYFTITPRAGSTIWAWLVNRPDSGTVEIARTETE